MSHAVRFLVRGWDDYWFTPVSPFDLGFGRLLYCGFLFLYFLGWDVSAWGIVPGFLWLPDGFFQLFSIPLASPGLLYLLQVVWKVALLLAAVGLFTRPSLAVALLLSLYLLGVPQNFGKIGHGEAIAPLVLVVLLASRCGDAWSLDALLRARRAGPAARARVEPSGRYGWPVRAIWMVTALVVASAGYAKLRTSGLEWITSEQMATQLVKHQYYYGGFAWTSWGPFLAQYRPVTFLLAAGTILIETGLPLAMFSAKLRAVLVPGALAMLLSFAVLLGPFFILLIMSFVFWIPWERLAARLRPAPPAAAGSPDPSRS